MRKLSNDRVIPNTIQHNIGLLYEFYFTLNLSDSARFPTLISRFGFIKPVQMAEPIYLGHVTV